MNLPDQHLLPTQAEALPTQAEAPPTQAEAPPTQAEPLPGQPAAGTANGASRGSGASAGGAEPAVRAAELPEPWRSAAVTVVLPTYQEASNIRLITDALLRLPLPNLRILVADDNSPDGTGQIAEDLAARRGDGRVAVVHRPGKEGLGRAYIDGMTRAMAGGADYVVQMDADLSHDPGYLPGMLGTLLSTGADVVIGSRYVVGASVGDEWPWYRKALSSFANTYVRTLLGLGIRDVTAGYKIWRSSALLAIGLPTIRSNGYSFQVEMNYRSVSKGFKIVEVPVHFSDRTEGESKMTLKVQLESAFMPFKIRRDVRGKPRPERLL